MSHWHAVEMHCLLCQTWYPTGAASTQENFDSVTPAVLGGNNILACGHALSADPRALRLGAEILRPGAIAPARTCGDDTGT